MNLWYGMMVLLGGLSTALWLAYLGRPNRYVLVSPVGAFFFAWMVFIQLPALYTYPATLKGLTNSADFALAIPICSLIVLGTVVLVSDRGTRQWRQWWMEETCYTSTDRSLTIFFWVLIIAITGWEVIHHGAEAPLVQMIRNPGSALELKEARREFTEAGLFRYFAEYRDRLFVLIPITATAAIVWTRRRGYLKLSGLVIAGFLILGLSLARIKPARLMAAVVLSYLLVRHVKVRLRHLLIGGFVVLLFPAIVQMFKYRQHFEWGAVLGIYRELGDRIFLVPDVCLAGHFALVPAQTGGFLHGQTVGLFAYLTQQTSYPIAYAVAYYVFEGQYLGSSMANAAYPGAAWADFGWFGIVIYSIVLGLWLAAFDSMGRHSPKTPIVIGFVLAADILVVDLVSVPLTNFLLGFGGLLAVVLMFFVKHALPERGLSLPEYEAEGQAEPEGQYSYPRQA